MPFLKPTGIDRPEARLRCTWLSVVRAPIAAQATVSAKNCGEIGSRNSQPVGRPSAIDVQQQPARQAQPVVDGVAAVEVRVVDQPAPADGGARLLEVHAHDDAQIGGQRGLERGQQRWRTRAPRRYRAPSTAQRSQSGGRRGHPEYRPAARASGSQTPRPRVGAADLPSGLPAAAADGSLRSADRASVERVALHWSHSLRPCASIIAFLVVPPARQRRREQPQRTSTHRFVAPSIGAHVTLLRASAIVNRRRGSGSGERGAGIRDRDRDQGRWFQTGPYGWYRRAAVGALLAAPFRLLERCVLAFKIGV